tara:strand:- start:1693 stop:1968 length:276 start_codon:yes stop_codon:yes gene_type:complete
MPLKQRILYLSAESTDPKSPTISQALHEPFNDDIVEIDPTSKELDYKTVHEAVVDGWKIIHFPDQRSSMSNLEEEIIGFQFILEKIENYSE